MGFAETFDPKWLREAEIKHGRVSMLAILGHIVTSSGTRLPGDIAYGVPFSSIKSGLAAWEGVPVGGIVQMVIFIGLIEMGFETRKEEIEKEKRLAGLRGQTWRVVKALACWHQPPHEVGGARED